MPEPAVALITVGEADLDSTLAGIPYRWRDRVVLVQNELLPRNWMAHGYDNPTVAVVWFEKKPGRAENVIIPTPIWGPRAGMLVNALQSIDIAAVELTNTGDLMYELVRKNMYILTANICLLYTSPSPRD